MTRLLSASSLFVLAAASAAYGQKICDPEDPRLCSQFVLQGDKAPFTGQLLTTELAISLGQKADGCSLRIDAEVAYARKLSAIDLGLERRLHQLDVQVADRQLALLERRYEAALDEPLYRQPWFVAAVAVAATVLMYTAAVKAVQALR